MLQRLIVVICFENIALQGKRGKERGLKQRAGCEVVINGKFLITALVRLWKYPLEKAVMGYTKKGNLHKTFATNHICVFAYSLDDSFQPFKKMCKA